MKDAISPKDVAKTVKFVLSFDNIIEFPEIGIKHVQG
ncbi:MAG: hypothetical protein ACD_37C00642G0005 [uncultured bacterium]|nr:MAG: hypothetical protein ACD_37C00642G0005 [uncultured bacterium]